ncbi:hypothetical protein [Halobacillus mangrovi]|uniref:DUF4179 domain-containing protein n=1 Tax=Halobacillus mangrovi TaxID=402384 RepID=A0A1W6A031_9BACI|nr:hypothetical protein [Halobacillus mangrovi]ARI78928.1 hypothetical protein HM131_19775 [Halobacillus mangrovi]
MRSKSKWIGIVAVLLAFAVGTYVMTADSDQKLTYSKDSKPQRKAKPVDKDQLPIQWNEVDTYTQVQDFFDEYIPGLQLAREYNVTTTINQSAPIPGRDGRMQVNEVWHSGHVIHIFYSIDLSALIEGGPPGDAPYLKQISIEDNDGIEDQTLRSFGQPIRFEQGVIFENRLYTVVQIPPITETNSPPGKWDPENTIPFDQTLSTLFQLEFGGQSYQPDAIPIHYQYDPAKNILGTYTFDDAYSQEGLMVEPLELKLGIEFSHIKLKIKSEHAQFNRSLDATLITDEDEHIPLSLYLSETKQEDVYIGFVRPLRSVPQKATLKIRNIHLRNGSSYSFSVDVSQIKNKNQENQRIDKKVAEAFQTNVYLREISSRGAAGVDLSLAFRPQNYEQTTKLIGVSPSPLDSESYERPQVVHLENDKGEATQTEYGGSERSAFITIEEDLLTGANQLEVTVKDIVFSKKIDQTFEIDLE